MTSPPPTMRRRNPFCRHDNGRNVRDVTAACCVLFNSCRFRRPRECTCLVLSLLKDHKKRTCINASTFDGANFVTVTVSVCLDHVTKIKVCTTTTITTKITNTAATSIGDAGLSFSSYALNPSSLSPWLCHTCLSYYAFLHR